MPKLIRTVAYGLNPYGYDSDSITNNEIGSVSEIPIDTIVSRRSADEYPSFDSAYIHNNKHSHIYQHHPDTAFSAVGYADPYYSLYPLVALHDDAPEYNSGNNYSKYAVLNNTEWHIPIESLPDSLAAYTKKYGFNALLNVLKKKLFDKYASETGDNRKYTSKSVRYDDPEYYTVDNLYDNGLHKYLAQMKDGIQDKAKYRRLLKGLRGYSSNPKQPSYNTPQIALIDVDDADILNAKDKMYFDSAEQDGPHEYRVHKYTINGLWSPSTVDSIIKKHYKDYDGFNIGYTLRKDSDESKAKDTISDIIHTSADEILSDEHYKNIINALNNSTSIKNIANSIKELGQ